MGPCRGARIGSCKSARRGTQWTCFNGAVPGGTDRDVAQVMWDGDRSLQWGRAGGHGSGPIMTEVPVSGAMRFNGAVPGGTDRDRNRRASARARKRFNGAVPGGTDRVHGHVRPLLRRQFASMGPCRGARIGQDPRRVDSLRRGASMGPCRGARIGSIRDSPDGRGRGASMGPCRGARIGPARRVDLIVENWELQWGRAGGHGSGQPRADAGLDHQASMGPCRGARIGLSARSASSLDAKLQWGRAGGHGSGWPRISQRSNGRAFNGAVPGGTDRGRSACCRRESVRCFNGAVPGGTDRGEDGSQVKTFGSLQWGRAGGHGSGTEAVICAMDSVP